MRYPLATSGWDEKELAAIQSVIQSNNFTMGRAVASFEAAFAAYVGSRYAVMVNSGSSANLLAVAALFFRKANNIQPGDEVIVPAVSWATTYYPLTQYGLKLKFVDIDRNTLNFDLSALREAVGERTRLIMTVNLLGNPNDFDAIRSIIAGKDIVLLEDNCESMGATFGGRQAGTFGAMGTFSSFFSHHISTMEGGLVVTDDEELYHILLSLRAHGWTRQLPKDNKLGIEIGDDPFYESFRFVLPGYNVRPLEMSGALGLCQLEKLPSFVAARRRNAVLFQEMFSNHPLVRIQSEIGESSWFGFSLVVREDSGSSRSQLVDALRAAGIECRPIVAGNFVRNPVICHLPHEVHGILRGADDIHENGVFVGNHQYPIEAELDLLRKTVNGLRP